MNYNIIATCTFGLESVLKNELLGLGYSDLNVQDGRVTFKSDEVGIARTNIFLRTADRVYLKLSEFPANDFDQLFEGVKKINWQDMIPEDGIMHVNGRSKKSKLSSVPACQSITKKAIIEKMKLHYKIDKFTEDGTKFPIEIILENLTLDGAVLNNAQLKGIKLEKSTLVRASLKNANLGQPFQTEIRSILNDVNLQKATCTRATFNYAIMIKCGFEGATLNKAKFKFADLRGANFTDANLCEAELDGADLRLAQFIKADMEGAIMVGADLRAANFDGANLKGTNLFGAKIYHSQLTKIQTSSIEKNRPPKYMEEVADDKDEFILPYGLQ